MVIKLLLLGVPIIGLFIILFLAAKIAYDSHKLSKDKYSFEIYYPDEVVFKSEFKDYSKEIATMTANNIIDHMIQKSIYKAGDRSLIFIKLIKED